MKNYIEFFDEFGKGILIPTKNIRDVENIFDETIIRLFVREEMSEQNVPVVGDLAEVRNLVKQAKEQIIPNIEDKTLSVNGPIGNHIIVKISDIALIYETSYKRACIITSSKSRLYTLYVNEYYQDIKKLIEVLENRNI